MEQRLDSATWVLYIVNVNLKHGSLRQTRALFATIGAP